MTEEPHPHQPDLAAAYRSHAAALTRGARERGLEDIGLSVEEMLADLPRSVVLLTVSTQLMEQMSWLERPGDPLPEGVLSLATSNVLRQCAMIVAALDVALHDVCGDEHDAAMWTIEALRVTRAADEDRVCTLGLRFADETSAELLELATAVGRATVSVHEETSLLAARLSVALGRAMAIYIATERLERAAPIA